MLLKGTMKEIPRQRVAPPNDGVHRVSSVDGLLKGCRSVMFNDTCLIPKGMTGMYYRYKEDKGVKIFYSMRHNTCSKKRTVKHQFKKHVKLWRLGLASEPIKMIKVELDFDRYDKAGTLERHVKTVAYGIVVRHVHYPEKAWEAYAKGNAYDFTCLDGAEHPTHNPGGYLKFCHTIKKVLVKHKIGVCGNFPFDEKKPPKLGDVVYCCKQKRWFLVDVG